MGLKVREEIRKIRISPPFTLEEFGVRVRKVCYWVEQLGIGETLEFGIKYVTITILGPSYIIFRMVDTSPSFYVTAHACDGFVKDMPFIVEFFKCLLTF